MKDFIGVFYFLDFSFSCNSSQVIAWTRHWAQGDAGWAQRCCNAVPCHSAQQLDHLFVSLDIVSDLYNPMISTLEIYIIFLAKDKSASIWRHILAPSLVILPKHQTKPPIGEARMTKMKISFSGMMTGNYFKSGTRGQVVWKSCICFTVRVS